MADYKKMYYELLRATAQASELLVAAQQEAEETFLQAQEVPLFVLEKVKQPSPKDK